MTTYILLAATIYSLKINVYLHRDQHNPRHDHWSLIREMRCLRNKIHANLFLTFVLDCTFWMATDILQGRELPTTGLKVQLLLNSLKNVRAYYQGGGVSFTVKWLFLCTGSPDHSSSCPESIIVLGLEWMIANTPLECVNSHFNISAMVFSVSASNYSASRSDGKMPLPIWYIFCIYVGICIWNKKTFG